MISRRALFGFTAGAAASAVVPAKAAFDASPAGYISAAERYGAALALRRSFPMKELDLTDCYVFKSPAADTTSPG